MNYSTARKTLLLTAIVLPVLACSSGDKPKTFCQELQDKSDACQVASVVDCASVATTASSMQAGIRACLIPADCTEWQGYITKDWMSSAVLACFTKQGVEVNGLFSCANGNGGVPDGYRCDNIPNCPDGSDEWGC